MCFALLPPSHLLQLCDIANICATHSFSVVALHTSVRARSRPAGVLVSCRDGYEMVPSAMFTWLDVRYLVKLKTVFALLPKVTQPQRDRSGPMSIRAAIFCMNGTTCEETNGTVITIQAGTRAGYWIQLCVRHDMKSVLAHLTVALCRLL